MFLGRKLKTYQMSVLILHLEDLVSDGRRKLKTYQVSESHLHGEDLMLLGRKLKTMVTYGMT